MIWGILAYFGEIFIQKSASTAANPAKCPALILGRRHCISYVCIGYNGTLVPRRSFQAGRWQAQPSGGRRRLC